MKKNKLALLIGLLFIFTLMIRGVRADETNQTLISGKMVAAEDGRPLAGVILIEKGRLYGKNYQFSGLVDENGTFAVKVPEGGDYALHLYATGYIYFPIGVEVQTGKENQFNISLPPNAAIKEAPAISKVSFKPRAGDPEKVVIELWVDDPNEDLSHQVLGANIKTQEGFIFKPPEFVFPWTKIYPDGVYSLTYDTKGRSFDPKEWFFVAADNRCYNSAVLAHPFTEQGIVQAKASGKQKVPPSAMEAPDTRELAESGRKTYKNNCAICHHADKRKKKVGPGLKGLFKMRVTPGRKLPVTEENIRHQIQDGSKRMPPYSHIKGETLQALIAYLESL